MDPRPILGSSPLVFVTDRTPSPTRNRVDFARHVRLFNFQHRIHDTNRERFGGMVELGDSFTADFAAAVLAHLQESGFIADALFVEALDYCTDLLLDRGYSFSHFEELQRELQSNSPCVMVIAGCQDRPLLRARVDAAVETLRRLQTHLQVPFRVVFSGLNPDARNPGTPVRTVNEAREMQAYFFTRWERLPLQHERAPVEVLPRLEELSTRTVENIDNCLTSDYLHDTANYLFVVSSTCHLPKLAERIDSKLDEQRELPITRLALIGAETTGQPVTSPSRYLKTMMHDVINDVLRQRAKAGQAS